MDAAALDQPVGVERRHAEDDADGEATGVADDRRVRDRLAVQLRDAVGRLAEQVGGGVLVATDRGVAIGVAGVLLGGGEAEVTRVVDEAASRGVESRSVLL